MAGVRSQKTSGDPKKHAVLAMPPGKRKHSMPPSTYEVFLSFRGEDIRHSFISHLYKALVDSGFQTFRDDDGIPRGEDIKLELEKAILESKISVVTISENYASSGWCLDELVMILKRKETSGHAVLPVFYHVDPSHVRKQKGSFAEAFAAHDEQCNAEIEDERREELMEKVKQWRAALGKIADLAGMELRKQADRDEALFIQKIVKVIGDKVTRTILNVPPHLIGIDYQVNTINLWLLDGSNKVGFMAICGMGGIGKTTMAKCVFNSNAERFDGSSFLFDINEISKDSDGVIRLQRCLISDILNGKKEKISSLDEGIIKIKAAICRRRVLIVFDDVNKRSQLEAIIEMRDWFYPGSKIIVTTRNMRLLPNEEGYKIHEVKILDGKKSLELFSWHAFGQDYPPKAFTEHSKRVVDHCGGLPLALKVLGSFLNGLALDLWKSAVDKLEAIPNNEIVKQLKLSYDSLQDDHDRNLFLDIVCFFEGEERNRVVAILDECGFYTNIGIKNLMDRCLLNVDKNNKLTIHQLIKDMGREIISMDSPKEPGKRSRLWNHMDSFDVLKTNNGTEAIEGLVLNKPVLSGQGNSLNRQTFPFRFNFFSSHAVNRSFGHSNEDGLKIRAFTKMRKLRILKINDYKLIGDYKDFPTELRWLCWSGFPLEYMPIDFPLERLVALDMCNSYLKQVWNVPKFLPLLKILNLSHSHALERTPDFSGLPNLERLILKECVNLVEIHESIWNLQTKLVLLDISDCKKISKLPREIAMLNALEVLNISGCSNLDEFPTDLSKMQSLKVFVADGVFINSLVSTTEEQTSWTTREDTSLWAFIWSLVCKPRKPPQLQLPCSLVELSLVKCSLSDGAFPKELSNMTSLRKIELSNNPICFLPDFVKGLTELLSLSFNSCEKLQSLIGLPPVRDLTAKYCPSLQKLTFLGHHKIVDLEGSNKVVHVDGAFKLEPLANIDAEIINNLGLYDMEPLKSIEMDWYTPATDTQKKGPIQGIYESGGIFSIFFPGNQIPGWFHTKVAGSSVSFIVPSPVDLMFRSMIVCYVYTISPQRIHDHSLCNVIINKTKGRIHLYRPNSYVLPDAHEYVIWLSHLMFKSHELEVGDEIVIELFSTEFYEVKDIGIHILYKEQEERGKQSKGQEVIRHIPTLTCLDHFVLGSSVLLKRKHDFYDYRDIRNRFCQMSQSFTNERYSNKDPLQLVYEVPPECNITTIQTHFIEPREVLYGYAVRENVYVLTMELVRGWKYVWPSGG